MYGSTDPVMQDSEFIHQMMYLDMKNYLCDDILTKTDRASMYSSLELRAPLLDHDVVEYAWRMRFMLSDDRGEGEGPRENQTKAPLRHILYQHVPRDLIERPKRGFAIPLAEWLRGPLKPWAENYLNRKFLERGEWLNTPEVLGAWNRFAQGEQGGEHFIWNVLMFSLWTERLS